MRVWLTFLATAVLLCGCTATQTGRVWRIDPWETTVAIEDDVYRVTDETRLFGPDGRRIPLESVPTVASTAGSGTERFARAEVEFRARDEDGRKLLEALWVREP